MADRERIARRETKVLRCVELFGEYRGLEIQALIEGATDSPCPCKVGRDCVLDAPLAPVLELVRQVPA